MSASITGQIPLVGGISFFTIMLALLLILELLLSPKLFMVCAFILVVIGVIDERYDISFKLRLVIQAVFR